MRFTQFRTQLSREEYLGLAVGLATSIFFALLYVRLPTLTVFDAPGHVNAIKNATTFWPGFRMWEPREALGWSQDLFYPPLFHWLAAGLAQLMSVAAATKTLIIVTLFALPLSLYYYLRQIVADKAGQSIALILIIALLNILPSYMGSDITGLFRIGLLPNFAVLPLVITIWGLVEQMRRRTVAYQAWLLGVLLGLSIWSHIVGGLMALGYIGVAILVSALERNKKLLIHYVLAALGGLVISSPVWIPLTHLKSLTIGTASTISSLRLTNIVFTVIILLGLVVLARRNWRGRRTLIATWFALMVCAVCAFDAVLSTFVPANPLTWLNIYRWQPFGYIVLTALGVVTVFKFIAKHKLNVPRSLTIGGAAVILLLVLGLKGPQKHIIATVQLTSDPHADGRFIDTMKNLDTVNAPYTMQYQLMNTDPRADWGYGLFIESGLNSGFIKSLELSMRSDASSQERTPYLPESVIVPSARIPGLLNLFGIRYVMSLDGNQRGSIGTWNGIALTRYYHLKDLGAKQLAESPNLTFIPVQDGDWSNAVLSWWQESGALTTLPYDAADGPITAKPDPTVKIDFTQSKTSEIDLNIHSSRAIPVLVKESYASGWKAYDVNGNELHIWRAAPSLMLVEGKGKITLKYN